MSVEAPNYLDLDPGGTDKVTSEATNMGNSVPLDNTIQQTSTEMIPNDVAQPADAPPQTQHVVKEPYHQASGENVTSSGLEETAPSSIIAPEISPATPATNLSAFGLAVASPGSMRDTPSRGLDFNFNTMTSLDQTNRSDELEQQGTQVPNQPLGVDKLNSHRNSECSDSEGPLPEIDSGNSEDDSELQAGIMT